MAAGDIRNKFSFVKNNCSSPALIPVNTRPLASYVLRRLHDLSKASKYLIIDESARKEVESELRSILNETSTKIHCVEPTLSAIHTLSLALEEISEDSIVTVLLVTTIPSVLPKENEVLVDCLETQNEEWSVISENKNCIDFHRKNNLILFTGNAFTGCFTVSKTRIEKAIQLLEFETDLIEVVSKIHHISPLKFKKSPWIDCGHEINYHKVKKELINSRSFNQIQVTSSESVIKKSQHIEKLKAEADYLKRLPSDIGLFFPRLISEYQVDENTYAYEMSYYSMPNVAELMLYWDLKPNYWRLIFEKFEHVLTEFRTYEFSFTKEQHTNFYLEKFKNRLKTFFKSIDIKTNQLLSESALTVNGVKLSSLNSLLPFIEMKVSSMYDSAKHCVMHGDFCFNNILYDVSTKTLKLIDARGSYSNDYKGIYGDQLYDCAKLMHSSIYAYDYLVNDLFELTTCEEEFTLQFPWRENRVLMADLTKNLIAKSNFDYQDVKFIVGLLFLSMTPLHKESQLKQMAMFIQGLCVLNEVYNEQ